MKTEIIPAIDIMSGRCVRLAQGDYDCKTDYSGDPVAVAKSFEKAGVHRLHLVDLDGARVSFPKNLDVARQIVMHTGLDVEFGGGIKSRDALKAVFDTGIDRAIVGSIAVSEPHKVIEWLEEYGPGEIILGADIRDGKVATHGWKRESELSVEELIERFLPHRLAQVICTDISKDGMLAGPNFDLYRRLHEKYPHIRFTVSGGISSMEDIEKVSEMGLSAVIVGKAFYEGRITLEDIKEWMSKR